MNNTKHSNCLFEALKAKLRSERLERGSHQRRITSLGLAREGALIC